MASSKAPTVEEHTKTRQKYVSLAWQLWQQQYKTHFFVWHPIPEEHLRIEVVMFWRGEISQVSGWTDILGQILAPIRAAINSIISWFWTHVIRPGIDALLWVIRAAMDIGFNAVKCVLSSITSVVSWISQGITGLVTQIGQGLAWLGSELTKATAWIWQQLQGFFSAIGEVLKNIGVWIINAIKTYVVDPLLALLAPVFEGAKILVTSIFQFLTGGAVTGSPVEWRGSIVRWLGIITGGAAMALIPLIGAKLLDMIHPMKDPQTGEIIQRAIEYSGLMFLQAAFFSTYFDIACSKPVRQELNSLFTPEIPGSGDLIRFVVREVIPKEEFYEALGLQGFHRHWSESYWEAHWILPPPERTRTAFLRKLIPEKDYRTFLVWYDFKPETRKDMTMSDVDLMLATQYEWPGRIETRWMLEWGQITPAEAEDLLKAAGLDPDWSPRVAKAYLLNQLRDEYNRVRTALMTRFKEGFLKTEAFKAALVELNFATHTIEASIKWANEVATWDEIWEQAQEWWRLAKAKKITAEEYAEEVRALGMVEERITGKMNLLRKLAEIAAVK